MAICIACSKLLGVMNTPMFKKGQTKEYGTICSSCLMILLKNVPQLGNNIKNLSNQEVFDAVQQVKAIKEDIKTDKKAAFQRKVEEDQNRRTSNAERLQEIREIISKLNPSVLNKKEVGELPSILTSDETIEKLTAGFLDEGKGATGHGLVVATNYRLIFIDKSTFGFSLKMEDFPYDKISSVSVETGFLKSVLKIICSGNTAKINLVTGAKEFSEFVRQKSFFKPTPASQVNIDHDIFSQIEKLAELKERGILTEEEFHSKKAILLDKI